MATVSIKVNEETIKKILYFYKDDEVPNKNPYATFMAKSNDTTITIFKSNKVLFQGKNAETEATIFVQLDETKQSPSKKKESEQKSVIKKNTSDIIPSIGSDEVGTGDYFGPVIVCAAYVDEASLKKLQNYSIMDSKQLTDEKIRQIAPDLFSFIPYSLLVVRNEKYNESTKQGINLNKMKALLHKQAITHLKQKLNHPATTIIDQFCSIKYFNQYVSDNHFTKSIRFETKAESKFTSVAVASIMARYKFLLEMDELSLQVGLSLQKGASNRVDEQGKKLVKQFGPTILNKIAKLHFKNTEKILND